MGYQTTPDLADEFLLALADAESRQMSLEEAASHFRPDLTASQSRAMKEFLEERGWVAVDLTMVDGSIGPARRILAAGWDRIEQLRSPSRGPANGAQTYIENKGGQVSVGDGNTFVQNFGIDPDDLAQVLAAIGVMRSERPDDSALDDIEAILIDDDEPPQSKRTALMWLNDVAVRATGSAAGAGIVEAVGAVLG